MSPSFRVTSEETRRIEDVVHAQPTPSFVTGYDVEYGDDHDGDPALWVVFKFREESIPVTPELKTIEPQLDAMNKLASDTRSSLVDLVPGRIVYVRFAADRPGQVGQQAT